MRVFNKERALSVLLEGTFIGDGVVARKYGLSSATVSAWRKRLSENETLRREYDERLLVVREEWQKRVPSALTAGLAYLQRVAEAGASDPEALKDWNLVREVANGIQVMSRVTISQRYADVRLEHLKNQLAAEPQGQDYLPDSPPEPKQIEAYNGNGNGHNGNGHSNGLPIIDLTPEGET